MARRGVTERMKQAKESLRVQTFQPNEFYETLLKRKAADREVYERLALRFG